MHPLGLGLDAGAQERIRLVHQRSRTADRAGHLLGHSLGDLRCRGLQGLAYALLLRRRLGPCALPFGAERAGHGFHGAAPAVQALLIKGQLSRVRLHTQFTQRRHQEVGALIKRLRYRLQCAAQLLHQAALGSCVTVQGCGPCVGHPVGRTLPLRSERLQLHIGGLAQALVRVLGLLGHGGHRLLDHLTDRIPGAEGIGFKALLQGCPHRASQLRVGRSGLAVKLLLLGQQMLVELVIATLQPLHQVLQALSNQRHGLRLRLECKKHFITPMGCREWPEQCRNTRVEQARGLQSLTTAHGGQEAQDGRCSDPSDGGAKGKTKALDRSRQRRANRLEAGRGLQRKHGTLECDHHSQERAQHAEHDQQAYQIGCEGWAGQGYTLALYALTHWAAQ